MGSEMCIRDSSKVFESFILDRIKNETELSNSQYGGIKGSSVEHFLLKTWDEILTSLENGSSATTLMSIDFAKAFNRMDHSTCLQSLREHGASEQSVAIIGAFLYNRKMQVKVNKTFSSPKLVAGGSPQGSISVLPKH